MFFARIPVDTPLLTDVTHLDWLDGGMITLATFTINFFHPGFLLGRADTWRNEREVNTDEPRDVDTPVDHRPTNDSKEKV